MASCCKSSSTELCVCNNTALHTSFFLYTTPPSSKCMYMFESKVYECRACHEFFFFKLDADEHTRRTSHSDFKVTDWTSPASQARGSTGAAAKTSAPPAAKRSCCLKVKVVRSLGSLLNGFIIRRYTSYNISWKKLSLNLFPRFNIFRVI